jgi:hypothetical protein
VSAGQAHIRPGQPTSQQTRCHFLGPSVATITGDEAVAVCESLVLVRDGDG